MIPPNHITLSSAAAQLGIAYKTLHQRIRRNPAGYPVVLAGGRWYADSAKLGAFVIDRPDDPKTNIAGNGVGGRLKGARLSRGLGRAQVAQALAFSRHSLRNYEEGWRSIPPNRLSLMATLYGVSVKWLETGHE